MPHLIELKKVMLFITNRALNEDSKSLEGRTISFNLDDNQVTNSVFFGSRLAKDQYVELTHERFFREIKASNYQNVLLFIHGYNSLPEDQIFQITEKLQYHFDRAKKNSCLVIPIIWPCDNDIGLIKDYWDDQQAADMASYSLARGLGKFLEWRDQDRNGHCLKRINILAHSMGNRVLRQTLIAWNQYHLSRGVPQIFRNIFLVAPDIVNESLEQGQPGELITHAARNVVVYHANDDFMLRSSKIVNLKNKVASRRLGHTGPTDMNKVDNNVYVVDCDDINNTYDFPLGHTYFLDNRSTNSHPGVVFEHILEAINTGRVHVEHQNKIRLMD